jgi:hypothetical protein
MTKLFIKNGLKCQIVDVKSVNKKLFGIKFVKLIQFLVLNGMLWDLEFLLVQEPVLVHVVQLGQDHISSFIAQNVGQLINLKMEQNHNMFLTNDTNHSTQTYLI